MFRSILFIILLLTVLKAEELSQAKKDAIDEECKLDVHAISELQSKNIPATDDSPKYNYKATKVDGDGAYTFENCQAKVIAIRSAGGFVNEVKDGMQCGLILDKTCFYAEQGGQIYDQGFITIGNETGKENNAEFVVNKVSIQGGYILHIGTVADGAFKVGDQVTLNYDTTRRRLIMNNHSGTHILNHALRVVLGDTNQKGSLVAPDRLRFDFASKTAMTLEQVRKTEEIVQDIIKKNAIVHVKLCKLAEARKIRGLRAMFDEAYPDPVRVVSVGEPVENLEKNPENEASLLTSVEFCGGTHVHRSGHIEEFLITAEEAIAKGIRRIIGITGSEALKALRKADLLRTEFEELVKLNKSGVDPKILLKNVTDLNNAVSRSLISYCFKDEMRKKLNDLKKAVDAKEKEAQAAHANVIVEQATKLVNQTNGELFIVEKLEAGGNTKALDMSLKKLSKLKKELSLMFFSIDEPNKKIFCQCAVSPDALKTGFTADEWIKSIVSVINGRGGGKGQNGQASGSNYAAIDDAIKLAKSYASERLMTSTSITSSPTSFTRILGMREKIALKYSKKYPNFTDNELSLFGNAAAYFISDETFLAPGGDDFNRSKVLEWISYSDNEIFNASIVYLRRQPSAIPRVQAMLKYLDDTLADKTFLVGDRVSLADVAVFTTLMLIGAQIREHFIDKYSNFERWVNTLDKDPRIAQIFSW